MYIFTSCLFWQFFQLLQFFFKSFSFFVSFRSHEGHLSLNLIQCLSGLGKAGILYDSLQPSIRHELTKWILVKKISQVNSYSKLKSQTYQLVILRPFLVIFWNYFGDFRFESELNYLAKLFFVLLFFELCLFTVK